MLDSFSCYFFGRVICPLGLVLLFITACAEVERNAPATPGSRFAKWRAQQVLSAFQNAGLDITEWRHGQKDADDGYAVIMAVETKRFRVASENVNGTILAFHNEPDQLWMFEYYALLGEAEPRNSSWLWTRGNIIVQIDRALAPVRAQEFQRILNQME